MTARRSALAAFSLLELLVIIAIIALLAAALLPAVNSIGAARNLENAGRLIEDRLKLARQEAMTRNRTVEFRFYKFIDAQDPADSEEIRAFQAFAVESDGTREAISRVTYLPQGIVISDNPEMTSLISLSSTSPTPEDGAIPRAKGAYSYHSFQFFPDGSTDLTHPGEYFLSVMRRTDSGIPPKNFATVSIETTTGRTQIFRP